MPVVFESEYFRVTAPERPHVSRADGAHLIIEPKTPVEDRTQLAPAQAIELVKLTMVAGEAMKSVLTSRGIDIGRINYQDNGNWRAELHVHLYGRARNATLQPYGHALRFPPTKDAFMREMGDLEPLDPQDIAALRAEIVRLLASDKYREFQAITPASRPKP